MDSFVTLSVATLAGVTCEIQLDRSATVADVRKAAMAYLGHRARSGKATGLFHVP